MANESEINVRVTANTAELKTGLGNAKADVKDFGEEINTLAQRVAAVKPDTFKVLANEFNAGKIDLDEFRDGLIATTATQSAAANEAVNLAEKTAVSSGAMREFIVVGRELASGNLTRLPGSLSILATRLGGIPPQAILAAGAIAGVSYALYEIIDSSEKAEADLAKVQNSFTAIGRSDLFDGSEIEQYIVDLRQIPGVSGEAANAIVNAFVRSRNGGEQLQELTNDVKPFANLIGKEVPQAAKVLAEAFTDPIKAIQLLRQEGVELTAAQQQQITEMMAVNDVAGAQRVLLDGISAAMAHVVDTSTGLQKLFHSLGNDLRGVNEQATGTRAAIDGLAESLFHISDFSTRNLPGAEWSGSSGSASGTDKAKQTKEDNAAISVTNQLFEHGTSLLREQELHKENLRKIQDGLNAAQRLNDTAAAERARADLEQEDKRHESALKRGEPRATKDHTDRDFERALAEDAKARNVEIEGDKRVADEKFRTAQLLMQQKVALGQMTVQDEIASELEAAAQKQAIDNQAFDALLGQYRNDEVQYAKTLAEKLVAEQRFQQQIISLNTKASQDQKRIDDQDMRRREQMFAPITRAFSTSIRGMVQGTQTLSQAINRIGQSIVAEFVNDVVKRMVDTWILGEATKTISSQVGAKARETADSEGANKSVQNNIVNTGKQQATDAVGVYSSVFNYLAPELGPFAAVPAALASASILALSLPSAAGGMIVPNDTLAMVHENEMVLPARYTSGITSMIDQANAGSGSGTTNHFHVNVNANGRLNAGDLDGLHDAVVGSLKKAARNGQFGGMRKS